MRSLVLRAVIGQAARAASVHSAVAASRPSAVMHFPSIRAFMPRWVNSAAGALPLKEKFTEEIEAAVEKALKEGPFKEPVVEAWVTTISGERVNMISLDPTVFAAAPRIDLLHRVTEWQRAKRRAGTASTKTKGEVRGGGRKPLPQKGSGKARQGSIRNPHMKKGGVAHGPKPRDWSYKMPKKIRRAALRSALAIKYAQGDLHIVDTAELATNSTAQLAEDLERSGWSSCVIVSGGNVPPNLSHASLHLDSCLALPAGGLNVYDVLSFKKLILAVDAVEYLENFLRDVRRLPRTAA